MERGFLLPGEILVDARDTHHATVGADGTLIVDGAKGPFRGAIHQVGAHVLGAPACNGWVFWGYKDGNSWVPIDRLRQKVRSELH